MTKPLDLAVLLKLAEQEAKRHKPKDGKDGERGPRGFDGRDGRDGQDGRNGVDGIDGRNGIDGEDGDDGVGIESIETEGDFVVIKLTDGRSYKKTLVRSVYYGGGGGVSSGTGNGEQGPAGPQGVAGTDGADGEPGESGVGIVRYIGDEEPDATAWNVNDLWLDTSTEV